MEKRKGRQGVGCPRHIAARRFGRDFLFWRRVDFAAQFAWDALKERGGGKCGEKQEAANRETLLSCSYSEHTVALHLVFLGGYA